MLPVEKLPASTTAVEEDINQPREGGLSSASRHEDFDSLMSSMAHPSRSLSGHSDSLSTRNHDTNQYRQISSRSNRPATSTQPAIVSHQSSVKDPARGSKSSSPTSGTKNTNTHSDKHPFTPVMSALMPAADGETAKTVAEPNINCISADQSVDIPSASPSDAATSVNPANSTNSTSLFASADPMAVSSAEWALTDPAGWLAAKLSVSLAPLAPSSTAIGAISDRPQGASLPATSTDPVACDITAGQPKTNSPASPLVDTDLAHNLMAVSSDAESSKKTPSANDSSAKNLAAEFAAASTKMSGKSQSSSSTIIASSQEKVGQTKSDEGQPSSLTPAASSNSQPSAGTDFAVTTATTEIPDVKTHFADISAGSVGQADDVATAATNAGTGFATTDLLMKNPLEKNKVAGSSVKLLPTESNGEATAKNLPVQWLPSGARDANSGTDLNMGFSSGEHSSAEDTAPVLNSLDLPSLADARMRALDRTNDMVTLHSMRLVESKMDALSVVIKPAIGTELSLDLRLHAGGVEAQATLLRGDHQFLSDNWSNLQERLEQRGVKLADLSFGSDTSTGDQRQAPSRQTSEEDAAQQASAFAEFAASGQVGGATARHATVHDGWEYWA